jgi:hypothetical protein
MGTGEIHMRLSVKATAISSGLLWGGCMLTCGVINLAKRSYARPFLRMMSSIYPGFHNSRTLPDVLVGTAYGIADGAAVGAVFAAVYNQFTETKVGRSHAALGAASVPSVTQTP